MVTELVTRVEPVKLSGTVTRTGCALTVTICCAQAEQALAKANNRTKTLRACFENTWSAAFTPLRSEKPVGTEAA